MALSVFDDSSRSPAESELTRALVASIAGWKYLVEAVAKRYPPVDQVWNFSGAKFGWSLRLRRKDRVLLYLIPQAGHFLAGIVLGERAVEVARKSELPDAVMEMIEAARPYAEGRGIRVPVRSRKDVAVVLKLVAAKVGE